MDLYERETDCDWTVGAFMIVRREALTAAGGFDARFFLYSEETDLCARIKSAGWAVRHLPRMTIIHHAGKGGVDPRLEAQNSFSRLQFADKHFSAPHRAVYRVLLIAGAVARLAAGLISRDPARTAVAARILAVLSGRAEPPFGRPPAAADGPSGERASR